MIPREAARLRRLLYAAAFLRALGVGLIAVLIGLYCARLALSAVQIGVVLAAALWGAALASAAVLAIGPRVAPRTLLIVLTVVPAFAAGVLVAADSFAVAALAAFAGMFSVNGRDRAAIPILEQALFPGTADVSRRTRVFAWYNVLLDAGYATGGLAAALPTALERWAGMAPLASMRSALLLFCVLYGAAAVLYARLPARLAGGESVGLRHLSPRSRPIVAKISALFLLDAFGGGLIGSALFAYFFAERFGASAAAIAALFAAGRGLAAFSHLLAAWLAGRIGLVNTMVFTHVPANLLLFVIAAAGAFPVAAAIFLVREALNEMDVPTRQSYVMAVVEPNERLAAAGITSLVRSGGWAAAPALAGVLMQLGGLGVPLVVAAAAKLAYDVLLWREFRRVKPPEEVAGAS